LREREREKRLGEKREREILKERGFNCVPIYTVKLKISDRKNYFGELLFSPAFSPLLPPAD